MSNKQPFLLICLLIITVISSLSVLNVNAQTENKSGQLEQTTPKETVGWQTYEDGENPYKIQYPQGWKVEEPKSPLSKYYAEDAPIMKRFHKMHIDINSEDNPGTSVSVEVTNASRTLDPQTLKVKTTPLEHYANSLIAGLSMREGQPNILKNEAVTFNDEPAWRVDYIWNIFGKQALYGTTIFVIKNDKLYEIGFHTNPLKVEEMRPVGEKIIQTFQFTNNTAKN